MPQMTDAVATTGTVESDAMAFNGAQYNDSNVTTLSDVTATSGYSSGQSGGAGIPSPMRHLTPEEWAQWALVGLRQSVGASAMQNHDQRTSLAAQQLPPSQPQAATQQLH